MGDLAELMGDMPSSFMGDIVIVDLVSVIDTPSPDS
jgi:hypothetical protein